MALDQPHDKFFKAAFSNKDVLIDFARAFLPTELTSNMDFGTLQRTNETYLTEELTEHYVDLLFEVDYGAERIQLALLFEHKSYVEPHPHFQINQYLLNYWAREVKEKKDLSPIVPVLVYHGEQVWRKKPVTAYFKHTRTELFPYVPSFDYVLINLGEVTVTGLTLLQTDYARLTALLLSHSRNQQRLLRVFDEFASLFRQLSQDASGRSFIEASFLYIYWTTDLNKWQVVSIF